MIINFDTYFADWRQLCTKFAIIIYNGIKMISQQIEQMLTENNVHKFSFLFIHYRISPESSWSSRPARFPFFL